MKFLLALASLFGPPPDIEAAVSFEPQCSGNVGHACAVLLERGVPATIGVVRINGELHSFVRAREWLIDNGRLCRGRVCLASDALSPLSSDLLEHDVEGDRPCAAVVGSAAAVGEPDTLAGD